jgi:UDP-2,3-diacylglucosamine pyrophosphatase LpxH
MQAFIISDLHLGNRYSRHREFVAFLRGLPRDAMLVLNGDTVDHWHQRELPESQRPALEALIEESHRRAIVWVRGNNDQSYALPAAGHFETGASYSFGKRLYVAHGNQFESIMPTLRPFLIAIRMLHAVYARVTGGSRHVAAAAKKIPQVYGVLTQAVSRSAVHFAAQNGYAAITCGHTHFPEETVVDGIRYINTGAWTEEPLIYIRLTDESIEVLRVPLPEDTP